MIKNSNNTKCNNKRNVKNNINTDNINIDAESKEEIKEKIENENSYKIKSVRHIFNKDSIVKNFKSLSVVISIFAYFLIFFCGITPSIRYILQYFKVNEHLSTINAILLITSLVYIAGMFIPYVIYKLAFRFKVMYNINFNDKENRKVLLHNLVISLLLGICIQPLGMGISGLSSMLTGANTVSNVLSQVDNVDHILITAFFYAIFPGIFEELVFRGVIFQTARKYFKLSYAAIASGICFGIMHMNLQQFVYTAILGIFFAYIYEKTKNIFDVMIIHFTIDFSQLALALSLLNLAGDELDISANSNPVETPLSISLAALFCFILIIPFASICHSLYKNYKSPNVNAINDVNSTTENEN